MGELNNFHINDDGSVTIEHQLTEHEQNIIDIFKIEKAKGGVFVSRRMKNRALKYAKLVDYPEFKVDKLMLDNYSDDFANYPRTSALIVWLIIGVIFLAGAVFFSIPTYLTFEYAWSYNKQIEALESYQLTGDSEILAQHLGWYINSDQDITNEIEEKLERTKHYQNHEFKFAFQCLFGVLCCLAIAIISFRQCRRISIQIDTVGKK